MGCGRASSSLASAGVSRVRGYEKSCTTRGGASVMQSVRWWRHVYNVPNTISIQGLAHHTAAAIKKTISHCNGTANNYINKARCQKPCCVSYAVSNETYVYLFHWVPHTSLCFEFDGFCSPAASPLKGQRPERFRSERTDEQRHSPHMSITLCMGSAKENMGSFTPMPPRHLTDVYARDNRSHTVEKCEEIKNYS